MCRFRVWLQALKTRNPAEKEKEKDLQASAAGFAAGFKGFQQWPEGFCLIECGCIQFLLDPLLSVSRVEQS